MEPHLGATAEVLRGSGTRVPSGSAGFRAGERLTIEEAAVAVGVSSRALRKRARKGTLQVERRVHNGRVVAVVAVEELERIYPGSERFHVERNPAESEALDQVVAETERTEPRGTPGDLEGDLDRMRNRVVELEKVLAVADAVEASNLRYIKVLDEKLEQQRSEALTLARALGKQEAITETLRAQLTGPRRWWRPWG